MLRGSLDKAQVDLSDCRAKLARFSPLVLEQEAEISKLSLDNDNMKAALGRSQKTMADATTKIEELQTLLGSLSEQNDQLTELVNTLYAREFERAGQVTRLRNELYDEKATTKGLLHTAHTLLQIIEVHSYPVQHVDFTEGATIDATQEEYVSTAA